MEQTMTHEDVLDLRKHLDRIVDKLYTAINTGNKDRGLLRKDVAVLATKHDALSEQFSAQSTALAAHMEKEEGQRMKIMFSIIGFLTVTVVALLAYTWRLHVGG